MTPMPGSPWLPGEPGIPGAPRSPWKEKTQGEEVSSGQESARVQENYAPPTVRPHSPASTSAPARIPSAPGSSSKLPSSHPVHHPWTTATDRDHAPFRADHGSRCDYNNVTPPQRDHNSKFYGAFSRLHLAPILDP